MATLYAVNAGGDWNTNATWSLVATKSAARIGNGAVPTAADDVILDDYSGSVTHSAASVCRSINLTGFTQTYGPNSVSGASLTIGDATAGLGNVALAFPSSGWVYAGVNSSTQLCTFVSTSATVQTINFGGKTTPPVTFDATSGGSWQYTGGQTLASSGWSVTHTRGTLDINGQTCNWGSYSGNNTNVKSLILGSATINLTGSATVWDTGAGTNFTSSMASSTINFTATTQTFAGVGTYGTITMTGAGQAQINRTFTCASFTRTGTAVKTDNLNATQPFTVTSALNLSGNSSINRILVGNASTPGTSRTITTTGATVTCSNVDFQDITLSVAKDFSAQTDVGDCGGCSGITFPASVQQTWSGTSGGNWSTNAWTTRVPLPQDDVTISSAFSASQTVTADMPRLGRSISFSGATGSPTWNNSTACSIFGSLTLISGMSVTATSSFTFRGRSNHSITSAGNTLANIIAIDCPTGTYTLNDALASTSASGFFLNGGGFNSNGFSVTFKLFVLSNSSTRSLTMGTSNWIATDTGATTPWNLATTTNLTFSGSSSTITYSTTSASTRTFAGGGLTYGTLTYTVAGSTGELDITGSNSFAQINRSGADAAAAIKFTKATTTTIRNTNGFNVQGTSGKLMTIDTIDGAGVFTLTSTGRQVCSYLNVVRSTVDASPAWYAQTTSTDGGTNTNWIFTNAPSIATSGGSNGIQNRMNLQNLRSLV